MKDVRKLEKTLKALLNSGIKNNNTWRLKKRIETLKFNNDGKKRGLFNCSSQGRIVKDRMFIDENTQKKLIRASSNMVKGSVNLWK